MYLLVVVNIYQNEKRDMYGNKKYLLKKLNKCTPNKIFCFA